MNNDIERQSFILTGKAKDVFEQLKAIVAKSKPEPRQIYRTVIITPETFVKVRSDAIIHGNDAFPSWEETLNRGSKP